jgi:hypothetical protein
LKEVHIEHWVEEKKGWIFELKRIATHNLSDSVRPIEKWEEVLMGTRKVLFMKM